MPLQQTWRPFIMMAPRLAAEVASSQVVDANPMTTPMAGCTASGGQNGAAFSGRSVSMSWRSGYCCRCGGGGGGDCPGIGTITIARVYERELWGAGPLSGGDEFLHGADVGGAEEGGSPHNETQEGGGGRPDPRTQSKKIPVIA